MFDFFVSLCLHFICATFYVWTNIFAYCDTCRIPFCNSFQINRFLSFEWVSGIIILGSKSTAVFLKFLLCVCAWTHVGIHVSTPKRGLCTCPYTLQGSNCCLISSSLAAADAAGGPNRPMQGAFMAAPNWSSTMGLDTCSCRWRQ